MEKPTTLFHGTNHQFNVGDFITPANEHGGAINYSTKYLKQLKYYAYATMYISEAERYAANAVLKNGGTEYVYLVQPFDENTLFHDDDAPYPDWHVYSVGGWSTGAYKTRDGFEVIAIVKQGGIEMQLEDPAILELISNYKTVSEREKVMKVLKSPEATPEEMIEVFKIPEERKKMKSPDEMTAYQIIDSIYRANDIYNDGRGFDEKKVGTIERWDRYGYYTRHMRQFEQADNGSCVGQWSMMYETRLIQTNTGWMMQTSVTSCYIADKDVSTKLTTRRSSKTGEMKNSSIPAHRRNFNHIIIVTKSPSGVRMLVKDTKTKAVKWGQFLSDQKEFGKLHAAEISHISRHIFSKLEEIYSQKDVMPIAEYLPSLPETIAEYALNYNQVIQFKQLHGFTARNMYWIGGRTSLVEILNRAYGKTGQEGLTRNAFGGMKKLKHFQELEAAINLVRMFKLLPREFFDNLDISWVVEDRQDFIMQNNVIGKRYQVDGILNIATEDINDFNKFFKTFGFRNSTIKWYQGFFAQTNGDTRHQIRLVSDTMASWKNIPLGNARKTLVSYVKQQKMNPEEIHDFVVAEAQKYAQAERKTPNTKLINEFSEKEILPGVIFVAPKTTYDLIDWGASQANCIGTAYSIRVANRDCYIVGFKDKATNEWIGHARLTKDYNLEELLGKHNRSLESTMNANICKWMKQNLTNTKKEIK
jgi:hypothetical protein